MYKELAKSRYFVSVDNVWLPNLKKMHYALRDRVAYSRPKVPVPRSCFCASMAHTKLAKTNFYLRLSLTLLHDSRNHHSRNIEECGSCSQTRSRSQSPYTLDGILSAFRTFSFDDGKGQATYVVSRIVSGFWKVLHRIIISYYPSRKEISLLPTANWQSWTRNIDAFGTELNALSYNTHHPVDPHHSKLPVRLWRRYLHSNDSDPSVPYRPPCLRSAP